MRTLITIGTSDRVWAPPKPVDLCVIMGKSGLALTNSEAVMWGIEGEGLITMAAIQVGDGKWARIDLTDGTRVRKHQDTGVAAGALYIAVDLPLISNMAQQDLPLISDSSMMPPQLRSRRRLLGRRFDGKHLPSGE